jgi:hypothetical protein
MEFQLATQLYLFKNTTVYKIAHSDVMAKPEVADKLLKTLVGERGFEPPTPWSRTRNQLSILLSRLGWLCVVLPLISWFSAANGPKSDPSFWQSCSSCECAGLNSNVSNLRSTT